MPYEIYMASIMATIFCKNSVVRRHHIYKAVWTLFVDEILDAKREDEMAMTDIQLQSSLTAG